MKKILLSLMLLLASLASFAYDAEINGIYYNLTSKTKTAEVTQGDGYSGNITIPSVIAFEGEQYTVTSIGNSAFAKSDISYVNIPHSVTSIGDYAFGGCRSLTSIVIPNSIVTNLNGSFNGSRNIKYIIISCKDMDDFISYIGRKDHDCIFYFDNSNGAEHSIMIAGEVQNDIIIPESVTNIREAAFKDFYSLRSVTIPSSVTSIDKEAFLNCSSLTSVSIPSSVTSIGIFAFYGCSGLTSVNIPNSVTSIKTSTFRGCSNLTSISFPSSVTNIDSGAFYGCSNLTSVSIPSSVTSIGVETFNDCSKLKSVTIGYGVTEIGSKAFANCKDLENVYCYAQNVPTKFLESPIFDNSLIEYATLYVPKGSISKYQSADEWKDFGNIIALDSEGGGDITQCEAPVIEYKNGEFFFSCPTEGVTYNMSSTTTVSGKLEGASKSVPLSITVSVYASKEGYEDSKTVSKTFSVADLAGTKGDVNADGTVNISDVTALVNIILKK